MNLYVVLFYIELLKLQEVLFVDAAAISFS